MVDNNTKILYSSCNYLGNAAVLGDNKPSFIRATTKWVQDWQNDRISNFEHFLLTSQRSSAFLRTLLCDASLVEDLLSKGHDFVITPGLQMTP